MYETEYMTMAAIAVKLNVCYRSVSERFIRHKDEYKHRGVVECSRAVGLRKKVCFTPCQEQLVYGSLLGDACLHRFTRYSRVSSSISWHAYLLRFSQCERQKPYLLRKKEILQGGSTVTRCFGGFGHPGNTFVYKNRSLNDMAPICLDSATGKKKVTEAWLNKLTWEGVAYWYQDDGCCMNSENRLYKSPRHSVTICTNSFSENEIRLIQAYFNKVGFAWHMWHNEDNKRAIRLVYSSDTPLFLDKIRLWIDPCMAYKIRPLFPRYLARLSNHGFTEMYDSGLIQLPDYTDPAWQRRLA